MNIWNLKYKEKRMYNMKLRGVVKMRMSQLFKEVMKDLEKIERHDEYTMLFKFMEVVPRNWRNKVEVRDNFYEEAIVSQLYLDGKLIIPLDEYFFISNDSQYCSNNDRSIRITQEASDMWRVIMFKYGENKYRKCEYISYEIGEWEHPIDIE